MKHKNLFKVGDLLKIKDFSDGACVLVLDAKCSVLPEYVEELGYQFTDKNEYTVLTHAGNLEKIVQDPDSTNVVALSKINFA
tara:strand:+ start:1042 stop:1287 length:246 start_codon:yes stop_codon:yes gene_type:complete